MSTGLENLAWGLAEKGIFIHILCGGNTPTKHGFSIPGGVKYHFTGASGDNPASFIKSYKQLLNENDFDFVVGWILNTALLSKLKSVKRPKFIANIGQMPPRSIHLRLLKSVFQRKMSFTEMFNLLNAIKNYHTEVDAIVSISESVHLSSIPYYNFDDEKCSIIPRGIDTNVFSFKERDGAVRNPIELLYAGTIHEKKGVNDLVSALKYIERPINLRLCGNVQNGYLYEIEVRVKSYGHQIVYMGPLITSDLVKQYQRCDFFVFPSHSEGLGKALLEAMACGCPVICSDIPTFKEIISDKDNGRMIPVKSPISIAEAIQFYIDNPEILEHYSRNARETVERKFSKNHEIDSWMKLLKNL